MAVLPVYTFVAKFLRLDDAIVASGNARRNLAQLRVLGSYALLRWQEVFQCLLPLLTSGARTDSLTRTF